MEAAAWGLFGTLVGAASSIGTAWLSHHNTYKIQSAKHADERAERVDEFQRGTLLELQEAIHDTLRLCSRAHFEDVENFRRTGEWGREKLSEEVNEGVRLSRRRVAILVDRISNESLRTDVKSLMQLSAQEALSHSEGEAEMAQHRLFAQVGPVLENIGSVLRSHY